MINKRKRREHCKGIPGICREGQHGGHGRGHHHRRSIWKDCDLAGE